mmetsp:Transcript_72695/g.137378  ORF Transcript_72695/g.137378 Transcript_72695/m.137378 type:complete len:86 (-) Transcript_72695:235-492(-)
MIVRPVDFNWLRHLAMLTVAAPSRPEVGSSMNIIDGIATSSRPMLTRFFCPPETPLFSGVPTTLCRILAKPRTFTQFSTCCKMSF